MITKEELQAAKEMLKFTEDQEKYIEERIAQAEKKTRDFEQWKMGGDMFYRLAIAHITSLARENVCDPFVVQVGQALHVAFRQANFPQQVQPPAPAQNPPQDEAQPD
jgi:hypothetical protein